MLFSIFLNDPDSYRGSRFLFPKVRRRLDSYRGGANAEQKDHHAMLQKLGGILERPSGKYHPRARSNF